MGDGPLADRVKAAALSHSNLEYLGRQSPAEVIALISRANCLLLPSLWYEGFPRVIVEAYAVGTPVIATNIGSLSELVNDRETGLLITPGDPGDLAAKIDWVWHHRDIVSAMRKRARKTFEQRYSAEQNYQRLIAIYKAALNNRSSKQRNSLAQD